jgi:hypothetical protein
MTKFKVIIIILTILLPYLGQSADNYIISQQGFIRLQGIQQSYSIEDYTISEFSVPFEIYWPVSRETSLHLTTSYAGASETGSEDLSGLSDTQISWNYFLENQNLVLNAGISLPTGKATLSNEAFITSMAIGEHYWNFIVPNFGQGFNISPGITWALPLNDATVAGLGMAYQIRGGFIPIDGLEGVYKPGDELLLTGGLDFRLGSLSTLSWDLVFTLYGSDTYDDEEVYKSGNKVITSLQYKTWFGSHSLSLEARYRSKGKNQYLPAAGTPLTEESEKTYPDQFDLFIQYRHQYRRTVHVTYGLEGRFYQELVYPGLNLFGLVVLPELSVSEKTNLIGRLKIWTGSFSDDSSLSGFEAGAGFVFML